MLLFLLLPRGIRLLILSIVLRLLLALRWLSVLMTVMGLGRGFGGVRFGLRLVAWLARRRLLLWLTLVGCIL